MKKSYALLGGAVLFGLTAFAAPKAVNTTADFVATAGEMTVNANGMTQVQKAPQKVAVADLLGIYKCRWTHWLLSGTDPYAGVCNPYVEAGSTATEVLISSLPQPAFDPIAANIDVEKGTMTIKAGQQIYYNESNGPLVLATCVVEWEDDEKKSGKWVDCEEIVGNITANGIVFEYQALMGQWVDLGNSYNFGFGNFIMTRENYFSFNASEWTLGGAKASFRDGWIAPLLNGYPSSYPAAQELDYYLNNQNRMRYAFANPYAASYWDPIYDELPEGATKDGHIVLNCHDVDCVLAEPLVNSGLYLAMTEGSDVGVPFYMYNQEGDKVCQKGYDTEELVDEYLAIGADPNEYLSFYKPETGDITVMNLQFGFGSQPVGGYTWNAAKENPPKALFKVLPNTGVEGIEMSEAGAVKYFNLQGIEVVNPAKGQLVIKKQGNKVEKVVM